MNQITMAEKIQQVAENAVLKLIEQGAWIQPDYANRVQVPKDFMADVWASVDQKKLKAQLAARLEAELADRIVNHLAAEISTDIKQILSVKERREALRQLARQHIESVMAIKPE